MLRRFRRTTIPTILATIALVSCSADPEVADAPSPTESAPSEPTNPVETSTTLVDAAPMASDSATSTAVQEVATTTSAVAPETSPAPTPVLPPDPLPIVEGARAIATLRWELSSTGDPCVYLEFADAPRVIFEGLGFEGVTYSADGADEAVLEYDGARIWTATSVVIELRKAFSPPPEGAAPGCDSATFEHFLVIDSLRQA
jgi:hypothetical protein